MTAIAGQLVRAVTEDGQHVIDITAHDVEKLALSGRLKIGDRRFDHVAGAIEFVVIAQVRPAAAHLHALEPRVHIAVRCCSFS